MIVINDYEVCFSTPIVRVFNPIIYSDRHSFLFFEQVRCTSFFFFFFFCFISVHQREEILAQVMDFVSPPD